MEPLIVMFFVFGPIFYIIKRRYDLKERQLTDKPDPKLLTELSEMSEMASELRKERKLLQDRIENLESIVCTVDYELNRRLASLPSQALVLAPGSEGAGTDRARQAHPGDGEPLARTATSLSAVAAGPAARPPTGELAIGTVVGKRYRIERLLGRGGMGAVYLAYDEVLSESVALKVISTAWGDDPRVVLERFRREASAARRISHTNVIRIHDLGELEDGRLYISMEYFPGNELFQVIAGRGTLDSQDGRDILAQVCDGLGAAHDVGVIHRDLKPHNILVGPRSAVKIIDFGLAKSVFLPEMTATGLIMGTPHYMSPEQIRGRNVDARSDIYSLGALTYHAMTGRPPFDGPTPIAIGFAHCSEVPIAPRIIRPSLSERLEAVILAALAKEPGDRPQSVGEFRAALVQPPA